MELVLLAACALLAAMCIEGVGGAAQPAWSIVSQSTPLNSTARASYVVRALTTVPPLPAAAAAPLNRSAPFLWHTYVAVDFAPDTLNNIASIQANVEYGAFLDSPRKSYFIRVWYYESIRSLSVVSKAAKVAVGERIAVTATIEAYNTVVIGRYHFLNLKKKKKTKLPFIIFKANVHCIA